MPLKNFISVYENALKDGVLSKDPEQEKVAHALAIIEKTLQDKDEKKFFFKRKRSAIKSTQGLYIYGGVGRGKTMLMDMFYNHISIKDKRRIHFHEFMIEVHDFLHKQQSSNDKIPHFAKKLAVKTRLLCLDEFHVTDITDAMILSRLFKHIFEEGIYVITTSNRIPDDLYLNGLQRDNFLPFIDLIKERLNVVLLNSPNDYRQLERIKTTSYFTPITSQTRDDFKTLLTQKTKGMPLKEKTITVKKRKLSIKMSENNIGHVTFSEMCEQPLGAADYIEIAKNADALFIENIPKLRYDRRNEAKRFILLIDTLYEAKTDTYFLAEAPISILYYGDDHGFEFDRTISRIVEMSQKLQS